MARSLVQASGVGAYTDHSDEPDLIERGPAGQGPPPRRKDRAKATAFYAGAGGLVLVVQGQRVPPDLLDAATVVAVWDEAGGCWQPKPEAAPKRRVRAAS